MILARFMFWNFVYLFRNRWRREELHEALKRLTRCHNPYRKFKPVVYRNDGMGEWAVWFGDESAFTRANQWVCVDMHIGNDSATVVGFDIWDSSMEQDDKRRLRDRLFTRLSRNPELLEEIALRLESEESVA